MSTDPTLHRKAYDTMMASLQADLQAWTDAPTVPVDFDPARPYVVTSGGGLTFAPSDKQDGTYVPAFLEPGNVVDLSVSDRDARLFLLQLGRPWTVVPVTAVREVRIDELTGAIEHLKGYAPPEDGPPPCRAPPGWLHRLRLPSR